MELPPAQQQDEPEDDGADDEGNDNDEGDDNDNGDDDANDNDNDAGNGENVMNKQVDQPVNDNEELLIEENVDVNVPSPYQAEHVQAEDTSISSSSSSSTDSSSTESDGNEATGDRSQDFSPEHYAQLAKAPCSNILPNTYFPKRKKSLGKKKVKLPRRKTARGPPPGAVLGKRTLQDESLDSDYAPPDPKAPNPVPSKSPTLQRTPTVSRPQDEADSDVDEADKLECLLNLDELVDDEEMDGGSESEIEEGEIVELEVVNDTHKIVYEGYNGLNIEMDLFHDNVISEEIFEGITESEESDHDFTKSSSDTAEDKPGDQVLYKETDMTKT
ncbi:hypothetical protein L1987_24028 [Smallanthus sonchifolius]|uniref:Uncharacterized protein n=1 Tax=Smallanthus sonchifolius TaxID=185202 RepID=A0ACB9IJW9_9ASTR|nr:hypothetical protein L1987_24028 [Smallanthus sonchifolius]